MVTDLPKNINYLHELKFDGYRIQALFKEEGVQLYSRNGLNWSKKFLRIKKELEKIQTEGTILDGEIVALDEDGKSQFHILQRSLKNEVKTELYYFVFDMLFYQGEDLRRLPLWERKQKLKDMLPEDLQLVLYVDHITEHGEDFFDLTCQEGLEGIVSKEANSIYTSGRSAQWVKKKCHNREEFVIGGWTDHSKVPGKLGALLLGEYSKDGFSYIGKVGTGFTDKESRELKKLLKPLETVKSPFINLDKKTDGTHWVKPKTLVEVKFQNWTMDRILRGGVYQGIREDKNQKDLKMQAERISSPEKIIFRDQGITKEMIALFYQEVATELLRWSKNRPLSIVRCPRGTSEKCFFQKHLDTKDIKGIQFFDVQEKEEVQEYFSLTSESGLMELVQLNAYELHSWNCRDDSLESPDQIVFDLDPDEGLPWDELVEAALELKELLSGLQLDSFIKLTGGKGVHIHVPIAPKYSWDEVKSFAFTVGRAMVERFPKKFTTNMSKKARKGKIFFDYLRNAHGSTAVIPYSIRVKERATVAFPIEWEELAEAGGGDIYDLESALKKLSERKKDPWKNYNKKKQKILILEN